MIQNEIFKDFEADNWFYRNKEYISSKLSDEDVTFQEMKKFIPDFKGKSFIEVGCSNGYRLSWIKENSGKVVGIEPSSKAVEDAKEKFALNENEILCTDASQFFKETNESFDVINFGHCLYLIPPAQIPEIVAGAINSLNTGGYIFIFDFDSAPQRQKYHHTEGVFSYKSRFDEYFTWMPTMHLVKKLVLEHTGDYTKGNPREDCALSIIRKINVANAFPILA